MGAGFDPEHIIELFSAFGPVTVRRMFGGAGIFVDGLMIGLAHEGVIHLKADATTIPKFEREGTGPFTYGARGSTRSIMSYWRLPERLYDDPDELARWARKALAVAHNAKAKPSKKASHRGAVAGSPKAKRRPRPASKQSKR